MEQGNNKEKNFYKAMLAIALPITLQNLISSSLNMVDTIMIGRLGETEIAAVGLANQIFFLFALLLFGTNSGASIFIAQFWGKKDIVNIKIPTPDISIQNQIVQEIESRLSVCDKIEESVESGLKKIEHLRQSILKKAFEGKLVSQDPEDPPAEELLKQIKIEKEKTKNNSKKKVKA